MNYIVNNTLLLISSLSFLIVVNCNATTMMINQNCSLVEAITAANTDQVVGQCPAGSGADELVFEQANQILNVQEGVFVSQLGGFSTLAFPTVTSEISIDGKGLAIVADTSQNFFRIFDLIHPAELTLKNLSITGAQDLDGLGSAIFSLAGKVNLINCQFRDNFIAVLLSEGNTSTITNTLFENNIATTDDLFSPALQILATNVIINNSSFIDNHVIVLPVSDGVEDQTPQSGGIGIRNDFSGGKVSIINTTISGNSSFVGGGISMGAFRTTTALEKIDSKGFVTVEIVNSTITNNTAEFGGGIFIFNSPNTYQIKNTIIAGNHSSNEQGKEIFAEDVITLEMDHFNFIKSHTLSSSIAAVIGASDIVSNVAIGDVLEPLSIIGSLKIHTLSVDSPLIDAGDVTCDVDFDQLGSMRPIDGNSSSSSECDLGAIEYNPIIDFIFDNGFE